MNRATVALAALLAACAAPGPVRFGDAGDDARAAIDAAWRAHVTGAQHRDLAAIVAMYADDIVYAVDGAPPLIGIAAVRAMEQRGVALGEVISARHRIDALRTDRDLAYELATVDGEVAPNGQPPQRVVFHFVGVWRRGDDGRWRLAHLVGDTTAAASARTDEEPPHSGS